MGPVAAAPSSSETFAPGDVVARRYRLDVPLGRGGYGVVFRAWQLAAQGAPPSSMRLVALKILHPPILANAEGRQRFQREAVLAQRLQHPNVVQLLDFGQTETGVPYIAFEHLAGRPLDAVIKDAGVLDETRAVKIIVQVLKALMQAHAVGIVHRDIKPSNVFICDFPGERDFVKVLDLGVAKSTTSGSLTELTRTGQIIGTPSYMAPELLCDGLATPAAD